MRLLTLRTGMFDLLIVKFLIVGKNNYTPRSMHIEVLYAFIVLYFVLRSSTV